MSAELRREIAALVQEAYGTELETRALIADVKTNRAKRLGGGERTGLTEVERKRFEDWMQSNADADPEDGTALVTMGLLEQAIEMIGDETGQTAAMLLKRIARIERHLGIEGDET